MQLANALQEYAEADDAAAGDEGGDGSGPEPLVLYDEEANLRLQVPGSLNQHLRSYQRQGVEFLFSRYAAGNGGVCCDDMGLGKTVQAISFIAALLGKQGTPQDALPRSFAAFRRERQLQRQQRRQIQDDGEDFEDDDVEAAGSTIRWPILVVCPTSVLDNWVRELNMWGTFKVVKYHGPPAVRQGIADEASSGQYEVILTSYDTLRVDAPAIAEMHPHAVIFDEAHKLKNDKSKQYEAAASLPTKFRYGLSGTIMQNNWDELYAVLDLLCPYCLGEYGGFVEYYSRPIKRGQSSTATNYEVVKAEKRRRQLVEVVKQVALRRTKAIIADQLPRKTDNVVFCQLQPLQYRAYDRTLASPDLQALRMARSLCDCGSGNKSAKCCHEMVPESEGGVLWPHYHCCDCDVETCKRHRPLGCADYYESMGYSNPRLRCPYCLMLPAISLLTKISNHLELIRPDAKLEELDKRQFDFELAVADMVLGPDADVLGGLVANSSGWLGASDETHCGKMATLKMLLEAWSGDYSSHNKVLLFSHSTRCLDLLEAFVQRQGYDYLRLDGSTPQKNRQGICDEFNTRPSIFLLLMSTVAGGLGLNLTAANKVVVFDPSWNPAHDLQAQDRAYRLGQTRDVAVYRLVGTGTLEEAVYRRQIYKQQQANMIVDAQQEPRYWEGVQGETDKPGELWGLWNLLRFSGQTVETRDILQAYQGRRRQRIEQQLQDDAQRQQQEQQPGQGGQQQQQQPAVPSGGGGGDEAAAGPTAVPSGPAAAAAAPAKPFKIIVLDQLVGPSDEDEGLEGVLYADEAAAGGAHRRKGKHAAAAGKRASSDAGDAEEGAAGAAAAAGGGGRGGGGNDVGGMAAAEEAWCDEAVLEGLLDDLMSDEDDDEDATDASKQQHKRQRRRAVLSDSDAEEGEDAAAAAAAVTAGGGLSPVAEGDELGGGADSQEGPAGSDAEYVYGSQGSGGLSADAGSDGDVGDAADAADVDDETLAPVVAVDPVLAALEEQGAILHVHRHEKVLGTAGSRKAKAAQQSQQQLSQQQPPSQQQSPSQQQPHRQRSGRRHLASQQQQTQQQLSSVDSLRRGPVSEAFMRCSPAVAAAAGAAGSQGWGPLASLAVYQGVSVVEMAQWLVALTPEERKQVLAMYAADMS